MATKKYKRRTPTNYTLDDILGILEDVMEVYTNRGANMSWAMILLERHKISPQKLQFWKDNYNEVRDIINELNSFRDVKVSSALLNGDGNSTSLVWYTKCNMGWIAEETRLQLESDKEIAEIQKDTIINIGWGDNDGED